MRRIVVFLVVLACIATAFARHDHGMPYRPRYYGPRVHHAPPPYYHHHRHYSSWGPGGRYFWPGFLGGVIGSTIVNTIAPTPNVVVQPIPVVVNPAPVVMNPAPVVVQPAPVVVAPVRTTTVISW